MRADGFALIEILIGLIILSVGLLAIGGLQIAAVKGNFFSDNLSQASFLGQDRLEILKSLSFSHPALIIGHYNDCDTVIRGTVFSRRYTITHDPHNPKIRVIAVTVNWRDTAEHRIAFSTIRSP